MTQKAKTGVRKTAPYTGEVVYIYAFDMAYDTVRQPIQTLLGQPVEQFSVDGDKRAPRQLFFYRPQMVRLPSVERVGPQGPVRIERAVKLLPVGAISITVRVPFELERIEDLVAFHDLQFAEGSLHDEVRRLAGQVGQELKSHFIRPQPELPEEEAYTVFCLAAPVMDQTGRPVRAMQWFQANRRQVAALLTQEPEMERLSREEADESTARYLSYYQNDFLVMDWDAALLIDEPDDFDEALYVMELANLQLAELEAYDRILDEALERSYRDLAARPLRSRAHILRELREIRIDMARFNDQLSNASKFFGDWHLARIYERIASRFHLADWHRNIDGKLRTLADLYQLLKQDQTNRWMMILEITIVLLFIIDLVLLVLGLKR
ncbi:MAG: hypothetical protein KGR98_02000 [Verrucomicrobia bacterium]|nr:hypothetical protein [Verrucomicrobiota bacterium]MDE3099342.1 hypothetical protein [Verrucomicrobiota bacterium]